MGFSLHIFHENKYLLGFQDFVFYDSLIMSLTIKKKKKKFLIQSTFYFSFLPKIEKIAIICIKKKKKKTDAWVSGYVMLAPAVMLKWVIIDWYNDPKKSQAGGSWRRGSERVCGRAGEIDRVGAREMRDERVASREDYEALWSPALWRAF